MLKLVFPSLDRQAAALEFRIDNGLTRLGNSLNIPGFKATLIHGKAKR
jgi:hypothetical protein